MSAAAESVTVTKHIGIFSDLSDEKRAAIVAQTQRRILHKGEHLVRQGDAADCLFYVLRGRFEVLRDGTRLIAEIGAGEPIGEIAFFGHLPRTADVVANRDSEVLALDRAAFDRLAEMQPEVTHSILRTLGRRLAATTTKATEIAPRVADSIGLCAAGASAIPVWVLDGLRRGFADNRFPLRMLGASDLPEGLDPRDENRVSIWLGEHEHVGERLLLVTGQGNPAWDRAALRHCDQLLLCGRLEEAHSASGAVPLGDLEAFALPLFRPRQLGLLLWREQSDTPVRGTSAWLATRPAHLHHHVARGSSADFGRVARFLCGQALGGVFGGGGALGASHIGALRALTAAGIQLDMVGGTSIGSCAAVSYAAGKSPAEMTLDFEQAFIHKKGMGKLTPPLFGLIDATHLERTIRGTFGETQLEDLDLNLYAVAASLTTNEPAILRRGDAWKAIRASTAIPAALPAWITDEGEVLVDGGIMDNVPVSVMRGIKEGPNLVFQLSPGDEWRVKARHDAIPSRARQLWSMLTRSPPQNDFPRIGDVVSRSMQVSSWRRLRETSVGNDLIIAPTAIDGMGMLSWALLQRQEAAAYEYTCRLIETLGGAEGLAAWQRGEGRTPAG